MLFSGRSFVALVPQIFFLFSEVRCINSDGWSSMSGFKEERIDGCFFRATYSGKGGAYDLTAHYSLLMWRNDRAESPMWLCTTPSVLKYTRRMPVHCNGATLTLRVQYYDFGDLFYQQIPTHTQTHTLPPSSSLSILLSISL